MTEKERDALKLLGELLVQVRGIAGDAVKLGHVSALGVGKFDAEAACRAIYKLADAAHNLPDAIVDGDTGQGFLFDGAINQIAATGVEVFGDSSTFEAFMPLRT